MISLTPELFLLVGPGLLVGMAWLETSLPIGLMVPAGFALALATFLSIEGYLSLPVVISAAAIGGTAGDWTGYWIGRSRGSSLLRHAPGFIGRTARRYEAPTSRAIRKRPFWTVTLGRTVAFVRTLMPTAVGASGMPFGRFVLYDLLGIGAWLTLYVAIGIVAGESWRVASGLVGTGWALVIVLIVTGLVIANRVRARKGGGGIGIVGRVGRKNVPFQIGLTGNVASGKSIVARVWEGEGIPVLNSDELAREVVLPGSEGLGRVVDAFGDGVLTDGGELDRAALRAIIVTDAEARARLEGIVHPRIALLRAARLEELARAGHAIVANEIPLLFEAGLEEAVDRIVLVDAPREERLRRLVEGRGLDPAEAERLIDIQMDPEEKRARAHHVLSNDGTIAELEAKARNVLAELRKEVGR